VKTHEAYIDLFGPLKKKKLNPKKKSVKIQQKMSKRDYFLTRERII
jgi:hypothetical protein